MFDDLPDDRAMKILRLTRPTADFVYFADHGACAFYLEGCLPIQCPRKTPWSTPVSQQGKVASLHAESLVHQGLNPANFLTDDDNCPLLAEFGAVTSLDDW